jgi:hypothetical protein
MCEYWCYNRSKQNIERLCRALEPLHPRLRGAPKNLPFRFDAKTVSAGLNFTLATDLGDFEVLGEVAGLGFYDAVCKSSVLKRVEKISCRVLSLDGLYRAKSAAGRDKDVEAAERNQGSSRIERAPRRRMSLHHPELIATSVRSEVHSAQHIFELNPGRFRCFRERVTAPAV